MIRKSRKALATVFYVPNDDAGKAFLKDLRKHLNRACHRIRVRGRNENRKQLREKGRWNTREFVPLGMSSYFAVYIDSPALEEIADRYKQQVYKDLEQARAALNRLQATGLLQSTPTVKEDLAAVETCLARSWETGRKIHLR